MKPAFSVIIATRNRPDSLEACLEALDKATSPAGGFEAIVVNDGGSTRPEIFADRFQSHFPLRFLSSPQAGPGVARNRGVSAARGQYIAFTDDDCRPEPGWLAAFASALQKEPHALIGGRVVNGLRDNPFSAASQAVVDLFTEFYNTNPANANLFTSNNMAMSADRFRAIGGFDSAFRIASEDRDLCDRWGAAGFRMTRADGAVVRHFHELDLLAFCRQHFRYGRGAGLYYRHRKRTSRQNLITGIQFHLRLPVLVLRYLTRLPARKAIRLSGLLAVWLICNSAGFAYETVRQRAGIRV